MKVLDLQCEHQHVFEGWFGSENDFQDQLGRGFIQCPMCGSAEISKRLSAPRINLGRSTRDDSLQAAHDKLEPSSKQALVAGSKLDPDLATAWLALAKRIVASTDDVGDTFPEEARKIHYGEVAERSIRGKATPDETRALVEEGINVMPMWLPDVFKGPIQ